MSRKYNIDDESSLSADKYSMDLSMDNEQAREYMVGRILDRLKYCSDSKIQIVYNYLVSDRSDDTSSLGSMPRVTKVAKIMNVNEAMGNIKCDYVVGLANRILQTVGRENITNLLEFEIHRSDMLDDRVKDIIDAEEQNIMTAGFDRAKTGYYQKEAIQTFHLTVFKKLVKQVGHNLISKNNRKRGQKSYTTYKIIQL